MAASFRAVRPAAQSFAPTASKTPAVAVRRLHITGANAQPSSYMAFQSRVAELGQKKGERQPASSTTTSSNQTASRPFNTTRALQHPNDSSPVDMAYLPSLTPTGLLSSDEDSSIARLIPLLPDVPHPQRASDPLLAPEHYTSASASSSSSSAAAASALDSKPGISLHSGGGEGQGDVVAALSESDGGHAADGMGIVVGAAVEEAGLRVKEGGERVVGDFRRVWEGFLEDLAGSGSGSGSGSVAAAKA